MWIVFLKFIDYLYCFYCKVIKMVCDDIEIKFGNDEFFVNVELFL